MKLMRMFYPRHYLSRFTWYRRWYGGRWERHWIDICGCAIWFAVEPGNHWPGYRQPCSVGTPTIEGWSMIGKTP